jgi:hypothetical protein
VLCVGGAPKWIWYNLDLFTQLMGGVTYGSWRPEKAFFFSFGWGEWGRWASAPPPPSWGPK